MNNTINRYKHLSIILILAIVFSASIQSRNTNYDEKGLLYYYAIQGKLTAELRTLLDNVVVQSVLLDIADRPREKKYLDNELDRAGVTLDQLVNSHLIRLEGDRFVINHILFTKEDMLLMREITDKHAKYLANAILTRSSELETIMKQHTLEDDENKAALFIILACFSLDWDGLVISANRGYRIPNRGEEKRSIICSQEPTSLSKKGFYKGSHNSSFGSVTFTSFGDHEIQPREALPDIFWRIPRITSSERYSDETNSGIKDFIQASTVIAGEQVGTMMVTLRSGAKTQNELAKSASVEKETAKAYLDFLQKIGYVESTKEKYSSRIPVLVKSDSNMVKEVLQIGNEELTRYFDDHYEKLKEELSSLTPFRHGVDLADYFYEVWHDIFGAANLILVKEGIFADPYSERYGAKGIIPCVYDPMYYTFF